MNRIDNNAIFKTKIWRAAIQSVKAELLKNEYKGISFPEWEKKEEHISVVEDYTYEVNSIVEYLNHTGEFEKKNFKVIVHIIEKGIGIWELKINEIIVMDYNRSEDTTK